MTFNLPIEKALSVFNQFGIQYKLNNGRIDLICPFHPDKDFGNCYIRPDRNYFFKCHRCGTPSNIFGFLRQATNLPDKDIFKILDLKDSYGLDSYITSSQIQQSIIVDEKEQDNYSLDENYIIRNSLKFDPLDYYYTKLKYYDNYFMTDHSVRKMTSGYYKDYYVTDISSNKLDVQAYEFRKIIEYEKLLEFFNKSGAQTYDLKSIRKEFKEFCEYANIELIDYYSKEISINNVKSVNPILSYLLHRKVLYSRGTRTFDLLFNYDNLDYKLPLYIVESVASIPLLRLLLKTNNITSTFGTSISDRQLELLEPFGVKIFIPDNDEASLGWIQKSTETLTNVKVLPVFMTDNMEGFKDHLQQRISKLEDNLISGITYVSRFSNILVKTRN